MIPGRVDWFELRTPDLEAATAFFGVLLGWNFKPFESFGVTVWNGADEIGMMTATDSAPGGPPGTLVYAYVDDLRASVDLAVRLGARVDVPPTFIDDESGAFACLTEPTGLAFGLWAGAL
ncbi:VOC family protein [Nonomuraea sp. NPDC049152]|uniref:VOC family protein n=1 Tax=Nonomuraea sp. NPDC049152 TaxID=3154350 RepID=UPI0033E20215